MMLAGIVTSQEQVGRTGKTAARQSNLEDKLDSQTTENHQRVRCWGLDSKGSEQDFPMHKHAHATKPCSLLHQSSESMQYSLLLQ